MSMALAVALVGMTSLAMAILLVPLLVRQRNGAPRQEYDLAVYRDQLAEVERDIDRGVLTAEQAEAARVEISRRMLALSPEATPGSRGSAVPVAIATIAVALIPFAALALYWHLGSPNVPDMPFADRGEAGAGNVAANGKAPHLDMAAAVQQLAAHLKQSPGDLNGWLLLGRSQISIGHYQDAVAAYRRAVDLSARRPDIVGDYGEALMLTADGVVTPDAKAAFEAALKDPASAARSRYYLGLAKLQAGDARAALQDWINLEADAPPDAAWLPILKKHIADAAKSSGIDVASLKPVAGGKAAIAAAPATAPSPAMASAASGSATSAASGPVGDSEANQPTQEQLGMAAQSAAAATPEDRQAMIGSMVARLATQLQQQPNDPDGWIRLGRSYMVLNQPQQASDAYARAEKLKPGDLDIKIAYADALVAAVGDTAATPPAEVVRLMREVLAKEPDSQEALWYVGIAEADAGHTQTAHDLWTRLLGELPKDAPERKAVEQRLAGLKLDVTK